MDKRVAQQVAQVHSKLFAIIRAELEVNSLATTQRQPQANAVVKRYGGTTISGSRKHVAECQSD